MYIFNLSPANNFSKAFLLRNMEITRIHFLLFCFVISFLMCSDAAENKTYPTDNVNLTPFNGWRSAYYCLQNVSRDICPKYTLNVTGWLNVTKEEGEEFCKKGGCADHTRAVLECLYDVKRDYWFANKAKVHHLNDTINYGCDPSQGFNGTSLYPSSGYKMKTVSIFLSVSAFVFVALF